MERGRVLFTKFLKGECLSRPPFVPLIQRLMAKVGGMPLQTLTSDPTLWANCLLKTVGLFNFDGVVVGFDFSLVAEACGCEITWEDDRPIMGTLSPGLFEKPEESGRIKYALETAKRVFGVCGNDRACVAALTGPVTLANQLYGQEEGPKHIGDVKQLAVRVIEAFCQTRPDMLIFMEGPTFALTEVNLAHRRVYNTIRNIVGYYNIPVALYLQGYRPQNLDQFFSLNMDICILGPSMDRSLCSLSELWNLSAGVLGIGISLPLNDLEKAKEIIDEAIGLYRTKGGHGFFLTSFDDMVSDVNLEMLHQLTKEIYQVCL